jgi:hypothetical protein
LKDFLDSKEKVARERYVVDENTRSGNKTAAVDAAKEGNINNLSISL